MNDAPMIDQAAPASDTEADEAWRRVQLARHPQRPRTLDLVSLIFEGFYEPTATRVRDDRPLSGASAARGGAVMSGT